LCQEAKSRVAQALDESRKTTGVRQFDDLSDEMKAKLAALPTCLNDIDDAIHSASARIQLMGRADEQVAPLFPLEGVLSFSFSFFLFFLSADDYFLLFFSTEVIVVNIMPDFESRYTLDCNDMSKVKKWNYVWIDWMFYAGIRINETMNDFGYMWRVVQVVRDYETRKARIKELSNAINRISDRASLIEQKMYLSTTFADIIWLFWLITEPV